MQVTPDRNLRRPYGSVRRTVAAAMALVATLCMLFVAILVFGKMLGV
jgi:hypothetical protein